MLSKETTNNIRKYAIKNAIDYGKAKAENVISKVIRSVPKNDIPKLKSEVERTVREINSLSKANLGKEYTIYEKEFDEKYEKKVEETSKPKMELPGATKGDFATRFAPEPSGYMHIGHATAAFLAQEFSKIYAGKLFLYFDDTNPEKESQEFVDGIKRDLDWLGIKFDKEYYASDNISTMYDCCKNLISSGKAYACECYYEMVKKGRYEGKECKHRNANPQENMKKFEMMLANKYDEGEIIIRLKGDMKSLNTVMRDPTLMRMKKDPHHRQGTKYVVWPTYDFNTPINDSMNGVTDAIRTKEYELRGELYDLVLDYLQMRRPRVHLHARTTIKGQPKQKRDIRELIDKGYIDGYDDPRLMTIIALKRRGIQPEAIREFVLSFGMSKAESVVDANLMLSYNKKLIDDNSKRIYYVPAPVDIVLNLEKPFTVKIPLHPSKDMGSREYTVQEKVFISGSDASDIEGEVINLKSLFNIKVEKGEDSLIGSVVNTKSDKRFQWVCDNNYMKCKILVPEEVIDANGNFKRDSLQVNEGYIENYASNLNKHEIVQLERFGFCILDDKDEMQFIFISK
jgi:glutamyl-tRNA synthetase